jgi:hypothetical protein
MVQNFFLGFIPAQAGAVCGDKCHVLLLLKAGFLKGLGEDDAGSIQLDCSDSLYPWSKLFQRGCEVIAEALKRFVESTDMGRKRSLRFFHETFGMITAGRHGSFLTLQNI